jgi:hypothetical protein
MNLGKVGFDPGHCAGHNAGPAGYYEGDVMLRFGLALQKSYDVFLTRTDSKDVDLKQRAIKTKQAGCDTFISLHTNAPKAAEGIIIFYSVKRPDDKAIAEQLGQALSQAAGLKFRGAHTRTFEKDKTQDYYGVIRHSIAQGIKHAFIVEHGSHWEFAVDTDKKIDACIKAYGQFLEVKKMDYKTILSNTVDSPDEWLNAIDVAVNAAKADGDLGPLEIFKYLPELIEKVYAKGGELK